MAISMADNFELKTKAQNFERDSFDTLAEMKSYNENYLPDIFTATCKETGLIYIFNRNNSLDASTGRWRELDTSISAEEGNALVKKDDGLYVGASSVEISKQADNILAEKSDGLYVPETDMSGKVDKETGKGLSTNDFTDTLKQKITDNESHIGDVTTFAVTSVSDLTSYCNLLFNSFMTSITYADKKLTITYRNGQTVDIDMSSIITDTNIEELKNVGDFTDLTSGQYLSYDGAIKKWVNKDVDLAGTLQSAKDYTDEEIKKAQESNAISCDEKPTYDSGTDTVTYIQNGETKTEKDTTSWFYYKEDDSTVQTRWINGVEFTINVGSVDLSDYVNKTTDIDSTFAEVPASLDKIPDLKYLNGFRLWLVDYIGEKVNITDIVDNLTSESTNVPLSANQGRILKNEIDTKADKSDLDDYVKTDDADNIALLRDVELSILGWNIPSEFSVQNKISNGSFVKNVNRVLLNGTWSQIATSTSGKYRFMYSTTLTDALLPSASAEVGKIYCRGVDTVANADTYQCIEGIAIHNSAGNIIFYSDSLQTASDVQSYFSGKYLYYAIATPIITQIDGNEKLMVAKYLTVPKTAIASGDDLNNYTTIGEYYSGSSAISQSITNCPSGFTTGFKLTVQNTGYSGHIIQRIEAISNGITWERGAYLSSGTWTFYDWSSKVSINDSSSSISSTYSSSKIDEIVSSNSPTGVGSSTECTASGTDSQAYGNNTSATGANTHAEGLNTTAITIASHAEGSGCTAGSSSNPLSAYTHAEGYKTTATGNSSHSEGGNTKASGGTAHAEGGSTTASGGYSHSQGYTTTASNTCSAALGHFNAAMTTGGTYANTVGTAWCVGNGTSSSALSNAASLQFDGTFKTASTISAETTADYAEFFEWADGNSDSEDRVGHFVTFDDDNKIRIATSEDDYILGVVSGEPFLLGNGDCDVWNGMYIRDEFRRKVFEPAPKLIETVDENGEVTYKESETEYEGVRPKVNPDYDPTQKYVSRKDRSEWASVGMFGVLPVIHDGTAKVNGYVTINDEGIATACEKSHSNSYRVIHKNSDNVVEILFR